jgi:hypothetical protein
MYPPTNSSPSPEQAPPPRRRDLPDWLVRLARIVVIMIAVLVVLATGADRPAWLIPVVGGGTAALWPRIPFLVTVLYNAARTRYATVSLLCGIALWIPWGFVVSEELTVAIAAIAWGVSIGSGVLGLQSQHRGRAIIGLVLAILALLTFCVVFGVRIGQYAPDLLLACC